MPFRNDESSAPTRRVLDPLLRFGELFRALDAGRGTFGDRAPLRLAAVTLLTVAGDASGLAARVRERDAELKGHFGWTSGLDPSVRLVIGAMLVRTGELVASFVAAITRDQALMREAKVRGGSGHEVLAAAILRRVVGGAPTIEHVLRMRAIYERMKHHHWFLTGPEDLTACAMLVGRSGTPEQIGDHVEAIYQLIAAAPKIRGGDELQTAANVLGLVTLAPDEAASRFLAVASALRDAGMKVRSAEYDEVAVLSFLPRSAPQIAAHVAEMRTRIDGELSWYEDSMATSLAVNLAFVQLLQGDDDVRVGALADAKLLLDMQSIAAMRQASSG